MVKIELLKLAQFAIASNGLISRLNRCLLWQISKAQQYNQQLGSMNMVAKRSLK